MIALLFLTLFAHAESLQIRTPIYEALLIKPSDTLECISKSGDAFGYKLARTESGVELRRLEQGKEVGAPLQGIIEREAKIPEYFMLRFRENHEKGGMMLSMRILTRRDPRLMKITGSVFMVEFSRDESGKEDYYPAGSLGVICK